MCFWCFFLSFSFFQHLRLSFVVVFTNKEISVAVGLCLFPVENGELFARMKLGFSVITSVSVSDS